MGGWIDRYGGQMNDQISIQGLDRQTDRLIDRQIYMVSSQIDDRLQQNRALTISHLLIHDGVSCVKPALKSIPWNGWQAPPSFTSWMLLFLGKQLLPNEFRHISFYLLSCVYKAELHLFTDANLIVFVIRKLNLK